MKILYSAFLIATLICLLQSCQIEADLQPPEKTETADSCRIVAMKIVDDYGEANEQYTYDEQGRIVRTEDDSEGFLTTIHFAYNNNVVLTTVTKPSGLQPWYDSVVLNDQGYPELYKHVEYDWDFWLEDRFEGWPPANQLTQVYNTSSHSPPSSGQLTWENGNMKRWTYPHETTVFEYYTEFLSQPGDYYRHSRLVYEGMFYPGNKNLIKSRSSSLGYRQDYEYAFDANGRITSVTVIDTEALYPPRRETRTYIYECP